MYLLSSLCNFSSSPPRPSPGTPRLRLGVPGHSLGGLEWSLRWPPRTTSAQVHRGQVQVHLGFASVYLDLALVDLSGVGGGLPRATPAEVAQVKFRSNSASPRWTWTLPVLPQPGSVRYTSATVGFSIKYSFVYLHKVRTHPTMCSLCSNTRGALHYLKLLIVNDLNIVCWEEPIIALRTQSLPPAWIFGFRRI